MLDSMQRRGFSLVELLVSIAIIALLIAIMLPSMNNAREQARQIACKSNLRNMWTGILNYVLESKDRLPFMEDVNILSPGVSGTGPEADPFDPAFPTTVGNVLLPYVNSGSWRCPSAVAGFPAGAGQTAWKMTYTFSAAGGIGQGVPYDSHPDKGTGSLFDPAISNYVHFDGRPIRLLDGRRYVSWGLNHNAKGYWNVRREIIADALAGDAWNGRPEYPHRGTLKRRYDLENSLDQFERNTNAVGGGWKTGLHEMHADEEQVDIFFTRTWHPHRPGY